MQNKQKINFKKYSFSISFLGRGAAIPEHMTLKQVHSDFIIDLTDLAPEDLNSLEGDAGDALVTRNLNQTLAVRIADCVPILLLHPEGQIAAIHAGWRGTQKNICKKTICEHFSDLDKSEIRAFIGPAISQKNYEVDSKVAEQFSDYPDCLIKKDSGKFLLDLKKVNREQLVKSGLNFKNIFIHPDCSFEKAESWHSHRREPNNKSRNYALIEISPRVYEKNAL